MSRTEANKANEGFVVFVRFRLKDLRDPNATSLFGSGDTVQNSRLGDYLASFLSFVTTAFICRRHSRILARIAESAFQNVTPNVRVSVPFIRLGSYSYAEGRRQIKQTATERLFRNSGDP
jgi:hypothetical protein